MRSDTSHPCLAGGSAEQRFCPNMPSRRIVRGVNEAARDIARRKMQTKAFLKSRDQRKRVEMRKQDRESRGNNPNHAQPFATLFSKLSLIEADLRKRGLISKRDP